MPMIDRTELTADLLKSLLANPHETATKAPAQLIETAVATADAFLKAAQPPSTERKPEPGSSSKPAASSLSKT